MSKNIVTHDGKFHADDVFAVAVLLLSEGDLTVVRTRESSLITEATFVVDVGGSYDEKTNRFDHHQTNGAGTRPPAEGSIPYASFGLVWRKFGEKLCGSETVALRVDAVLVSPIDASDNGIDLAVPKVETVSPYGVPDMIRAFTPTWEEGEASSDERFTEAVHFAKRIIEREISRSRAVMRGEQKVKKAYQDAPDKRLMVLPTDYSWKEVLAEFPEPLYVVHPQNGTWRLYCVRDNPHVFTNRKDLPKSWAGLRDEELTKVTGIPDMIFCHRNRFMAVTKTRESAIALATLALNS